MRRGCRRPPRIHRPLRQAAVGPGSGVDGREHPVLPTDRDRHGMGGLSTAVATSWWSTAEARAVRDARQAEDAPSHHAR